ncbi:unnamed protein product [Dibothriocephalus latus]|uniref:Uncharacterized protein n=1 Tax=Dibothriocephalus latus TaxID=60516 RepID=A0A3P6QDI8_DIBLA|nr:unnamed protein product [Dibothriocephalus latus]
MLSLKTHRFEYCDGCCPPSIAEDAASQTEPNVSAQMGAPPPYIYLKEKRIAEEFENGISSTDESIYSTSFFNVEHNDGHFDSHNALGDPTSESFQLQFYAIGAEFERIRFMQTLAGFVLGIFLITVVAFVMCYLAYRILRASSELAGVDFHVLRAFSLFFDDLAIEHRSAVSKPGWPSHLDRNITITV